MPFCLLPHRLGEVLAWDEGMARVGGGGDREISMGKP